MKYLIINRVGDIDIVEAEDIVDACQQRDWKYPGTVISASLLPDEE